MSTSRLSRLLTRLQRAGGAVEVPASVQPLHAILWENVGYLIDDERRQVAFDTLAREVGLDAKAILRASDAKLRRIAELGGMLPEQRVAKLREIALLAEEIDGDDLRSTATMTPAAARKVFARFPGIGKPGADKLVLLCGLEPCFTVESNGMRVLLRLGYGEESRDYAKTLRSVLAAAEAELQRTRAARLRAHLLLLRHGRTLCRRTRPDCASCPLREDCPFASQGRGA